MSPTLSPIVILYAPSTVQGAQEFTPMVDVSLIGPYAAMDPQPALVDSGAERSAIPIEWAELLGIDRSACRKVTVHSGAVTGPGWVPPHPVEAIVAGRRVQLSPILSDTRADLGIVLDATPSCTSSSSSMSAPSSSTYADLPRFSAAPTTLPHRDAPIE